MVSAQDRPLVRAFTEWFAVAVDLHDIMAFAPCEDRDAVEIGFLIGGSALHGYTHTAGISIAAMMGDECWDFLFDEDVVPGSDAEGWFCTACPAEDRPYFPSIETLWEAHLFEPLRRWVDEKLRPAAVLEFHEIHGGTSARLMPTAKAKDAVFVVGLIG